MLNSFTKRSSKQNTNLNDTRTNTSILPPEITSTPLISPSRNRVAPLITPTRKMLGTKKYSLSSNGFMSPFKTVKNPGPLLASTSYNTNVSTYIDTKSPGYTGRLVQYHEENSRRPYYTHQEKYDSPGCFPIVHFQKKDVPVISPKPRKATIRIGTPELKSPYSQEHSRLLLEGIVRNNTTPKDQDQSSDSTRSVLDALKEISRKRIHSNEEYELLDDTNKKLKRDCVINDGESSKRNRMDSPTSDSGSPPTRQPTKKICTIDAVLASKTSSMEGDFPSFNRKKQVRSSETTPPREVKRFNNAETQTAETTHSKQQKKLVEEYIIQSQKENKEKNVPVKISSVIEKPAPPPQPPLKVIDDKPLEVIRKNRLGALLSALTGREIPQIPMVDRRKALEESWVPRNSKKLTSILSPQNKLEKSAEKHVTFTIPENSSTESSNESEKIAKIAEKKSDEEVLPSAVSKNEIPKTTSDSNPSKSEDKVDNEAKTSSTQITAEKKNPASPLGGFKFDSIKSTPTISAPIGGFKFDITKPTTNDKSVSDIKSPTASSSNVNSSLPLVSESKVETAKVATSSPSVVSPSVSLPSFLTNFTKPSKPDISSAPSKNTFEIKNLSNSSTTVTNSLGLPSSLPQTTTTFAFGGSTSTTPFAFGTNPIAVSSTPNQEKTTPVFSFGKSETPKTSVATNPLVSATSSATFTATTSVTTLNMASFGNQKSATSITSSNSSTGNGLTSSSSSTSSLPSTSNALLGSSANSFAITTTSASSNFGKSTTPNFGNASNNLFPTPTPFGGAASNPQTSVPNFSIPTTSSTVPSTTSSTGFNFTAGNSLPAFGGSPATPAFGQVTNATSSFPVSSLLTTSATNNAFGNTAATTAAFATPFGNSTNTTQMFGTTTTSSFGSTSSSNNSFGSQNSKTFAFGSNNNQPFNSTSTTTNGSSMFTLKNSQSQMTLGTNTTASTASNIAFGSTTPAFGTSNNTMFPTTNNVSSFGKSTTVPSFGTTTPSFGVATTASTFGTTNTLNFGTNSNVPAFGKTAPSFGASTTNSMFGTTNTPTFGTANTTASTFGTSTSLNFGTPSTAATPAFGTTTPSLFGSNSQTFGTTTSSGFGTTTSSGFGTTNTPSFGVSNNNFAANFGSSSTAPFGAATTSASSTFNSISSPFGASSGTGAFGSGSSPFPTTTASSFGASSSTFGTNTTNFGNTAVTNNGFGSSNGPFGSTSATNTFGTGNMAPSNGFDSGFGTAVSKPEPSSIFSTQGTNMFGSSSGFGSSQPNGSGAASTNGVFTFGSPNAQSSSTAGVFAFGATEPPKTFNFTSPGQSASGSGGFPSAPSFGQPSPSVPSMFSIGSGSSTTQNRSGRPFARGKRRT